MVLFIRDGYEADAERTNSEVDSYLNVLSSVASSCHMIAAL